MTTHRSRWFLRALGPLLLVLVVLRLPEPRRLFDVFAQALGWELCVAIALNFVVVVSKVVRWQRLLAAGDIEYSFRPAWNAFNAASYIGLLTPGRVGDVLRVRYLSRDRGVPSADGLASILVDRIFDVYVLLGFAALGFVRFGSPLAAATGLVFWSFIVAVAAFPFVLLKRGLGDRLLTFGFRRLSKRGTGAPQAERFIALARQQLEGAFGIALALTVGSFSIVYFQAALIASAIGVPLLLLDVIALNALATLFGLLPVSVSGVGVRETLFAVLFPVLGFAATAGVAYGVLVFVVMYLPMVLYGFLIWQLHPLPTGHPLPQG